MGSNRLIFTEQGSLFLFLFAYFGKTFLFLEIFFCFIVNFRFLKMVPF